MKSVRRHIPALALLSAATALFSPGLSAAADRPMVIARHLDVNSMDPQRGFCDTCQVYLNAAYQTLVTLGLDNKTVEPLIAERWEVNSDNTEFTFHIDPRAKFATGRAIEAKDIKWSMDRLRHLKSDSSFLVSSVKEVEVVDPRTAKVIMSAPNSEFIGALTAGFTAIVDSEVASAAGAKSDEQAAATDQAESWFQSHSAGSGPYVLESYAADSEIRLARNNNYWLEKPKVGEVVIQESADAVSQAQMLMSGSADIATQVDPETAKSLNSDDVAADIIPSYNYLYVAFSPGAAGNKVPLSKEVRQAIAYAIDYQGLIDFTVGGQGKLQASPFPNGFPGTKDLPMPAQDLDKAKKLLADGGLADGFELDATVASINIFGVDLVVLMQKVQQDLARVNIKLNLQPVAGSVWREQVVDPGIPFTARFYSPDYFGSAQYVQFFGMIQDSFWQTRASGKGKVDLVNPKESELLAQAMAASGEARETLYREIALQLIDDRIIIPVVSTNMVLAYRKDVAGMHYSACCNLKIGALSFKE
ncbi:MAG: ABC transporter substrate-binding protein [Methylobacterium mesophilicum]|nr:ABC transporter substrate-binding protein [Methylobacterium mesophilicum]